MFARIVRPGASLLRCGRTIVSFGGSLAMFRDAQTAKPQEFRTGDGWFIYNLVTNLAQRW